LTTPLKVVGQQAQEKKRSGSWNIGWNLTLVAVGGYRYKYLQAGEWKEKEQTRQRMRRQVDIGHCCR
jgi:hypothetical protein